MLLQIAKRKLLGCQCNMNNGNPLLILLFRNIDKNLRRTRILSSIIPTINIFLHVITLIQSSPRSSFRRDDKSGLFRSGSGLLLDLVLVVKTPHATHSGFPKSRPRYTRPSSDRRAPRNSASTPNDRRPPSPESRAERLRRRQWRMEPRFSLSPMPSSRYRDPAPPRRPLRSPSYRGYHPWPPTTRPPSPHR